MSRFTKRGLRRHHIARNLDCIIGGSVDERLAEAVRVLKEQQPALITWKSKSDAETIEVGRWFRLLGYRTKISGDAEPAADMIDDFFAAVRSGKPYQVVIWTDDGSEVAFPVPGYAA